MSISSIVVRGYGSFGGIHKLPTLGYGSGAATTEGGRQFRKHRPGARIQPIPKDKEPVISDQQDLEDLKAIFAKFMESQ